MNLVGKILTVLILVFSIVFLTVSVTVFQTHRMWRDQALAHKGKIESLQDQNKRLQTEIEAGKERLAVEQMARRFALASMQTKYEQLEAQYQVREQEYARLQLEAGNLTQTVSTSSQTLEATLKQNDELRNVLRDTQLTRDSVFDQVVTLTDKRNELEGLRTVLAERVSELTKVYTKAKDTLARNEIDEHAPIDGKPPVIEGQVLQLGQKDLLEISIGADDGLKKGHTLEVYRNNSYLGRVVVRDTMPDRAVVQIVPEFSKGKIRVGDRVATKLG